MVRNNPITKPKKVPRKTGGKSPQSPEKQKHRGAKARLKTTLKSWTWKLYAGLIVICAFLVGGISLWGGAMNPLSSGFVTPTIKSVNGYEVGSNTGGSSGGVGLSTSGYFCFPDASRVMWKGYAQVGNAKIVNSTWLGWQLADNVSISVTEYLFTYDILVYTICKPNDIIPYSSTTTTVRQYYWHHHGLYSDVIESSAGNLVLRYLSYSDAQRDARLNAQLNLDVEFQWMFDVSKFGQGLELITEEDGTYSPVGFAVTEVTANAHPTIGSQTGYLSQPTIVYGGDTISVTTVNENSTSNSGSTPPTVTNGGSTKVPTSSITQAMVAVMPDTSQHFKIAVVNSELVSGTGQMASMISPGTPITLYAEENSTIEDLTDATITGTVPFLLQPRTSISQTSYTYNAWDVKSQDGLFHTETTATYITSTKSLPTLISTSNVYAIQRVLGGFTIATNYTFNPTETGEDFPDIQPPTINGTNGSLNPLPEEFVNDAGGNPGYDLRGLLKSWIFWIVVIVIVISIAAVIVVLRRPSGFAPGAPPHSSGPTPPQVVPPKG